MEGQAEGNNAISSGANGPIGGSAAYIDASPFFYNPGQGSGDICPTINGILLGKWVTYPSSGAVVDARGILPAPVNGAVPPLTCNGTTTNPFAGVTVPSTILLPASNIQISTMWTLPSNTRLIGEGNGRNFYTTLVIDPANFPTASLALIQKVTLRFTRLATRNAPSRASRSRCYSAQTI